jgi:hypothetical protein
VRRLCLILAILAVCVVPCRAAPAKGKDSPAAANTRKKLKKKIDVEYKDTRLQDVTVDLKDKIGTALSFKISGDVSKNLPITYSATGKPLEVILDEMLGKVQLGYVVVSAPDKKDPRNRLDGWILIKRGKERGYEAGTSPDEESDQPKAKKGKKRPKGKVVRKPPKKKVKAANGQKDAGQKAEDDPEAAEKLAAAKLRLATITLKSARKSGNKRLLERAKQRLRELIDKHPMTKAAEEARAILKKLEE